MMEFVKEVLHIDMDGVININEAIAIAIGVVVLLLLIAILKGPIDNFVNRVVPGRKKTIFSHRKNQYKNSIGKKSRSSKKKNK